MKPFLQSLYHSLMGLLTWVVLTLLVCDPLTEHSWTRIYFLILAASICWVASCRNTLKWERWSYLAVLFGAFLILSLWWANGVMTCLYYALCFACVGVATFRSQSRCDNLLKNPSLRATRIIRICFWMWQGYLGLCAGVVIANYLNLI